MAESFLREVKQMEGASQWVERGLICFGPPQTPKRKTRGLARRGRKTPSPTTHTPQHRPQTPSRQGSPRSPEGDQQGEGDTILPGEGEMDPPIIRGDMVGYDGLVGVPPTPMYTPYGQPLTPYAFGCGHVGPISLRGFDLGASPINLAGHPRFPGFPSQPPYGSQPCPMGFNPCVPGVPPMGFPRAPPPGFPPHYSQVFSVRRDHVNIPNGRGYWTGEGYISPNGLIIPGEPQNMIPDEEVVSEESEHDPIPSEGDVGQGEPEWDPVVPGKDVVPKEPGQDPGSPEEGIEVPDNDGQGQVGIVPDEGEPLLTERSLKGIQLLRGMKGRFQEMEI